jgi:hypothetical protein
MPAISEGRHTAEHILSEANGHLSRDKVTILSGQTVVPGQVLGKVTASGKFKALTPGASDGSEVALAIAYAAVVASGADAPGVVTARSAEVNGPSLTWPAGISAPDKTAAVAALATAGILVR